MVMDVQQLEHILEYTFKDSRMLVLAMTHPSSLNEADVASGDYQRLEFLGDAVLGLLLAEMLYDLYPGWSEGALSQLRSRLASQDLLADRARFLAIGNYILLGHGEEMTGGREKDSILSDVLESLVAALYRDGGLEVARGFVVRLFKTTATAPELLALGQDCKSELQELLFSKKSAVPRYLLVEESGPPHDRFFRFQVLVNGSVIGEGGGKSKKIAQQAAAAVALNILKSPGGAAR